MIIFRLTCACVADGLLKSIPSQPRGIPYTPHIESYRSGQILSILSEPEGRFTWDFHACGNRRTFGTGLLPGTGLWLAPPSDAERKAAASSSLSKATRMTLRMYIEEREEAIVVAVVRLDYLCPSRCRAHNSLWFAWLWPLSITMRAFWRRPSLVNASGSKQPSSTLFKHSKRPGRFYWGQMLSYNVVRESGLPTYNRTSPLPNCRRPLVSKQPSSSIKASVHDYWLSFSSASQGRWAVKLVKIHSQASSLLYYYWTRELSWDWTELTRLVQIVSFLEKRRCGMPLHSLSHNVHSSSSSIALRLSRKTVWRSQLIQALLYD